MKHRQEMPTEDARVMDHLRKVIAFYEKRRIESVDQDKRERVIVVDEAQVKEKA